MTTNEEILRNRMGCRCLTVMGERIWQLPSHGHAGAGDAQLIESAMSLARQEGAKDEAKRIFEKLEKGGFGDNTKLGYERFRQLKKECGVKE